MTPTNIRKHLEVKNNLAKLLKYNINYINSQYDEAIKEFKENFKYISFSNENIIKPEDDILYLTYNDSYIGNSPCDIYFGLNLTRPNLSIDDRGYIKGIGIDFKSYYKLRKTYNMFNIIFDSKIAKLKLPKYKGENISEFYDAFHTEVAYIESELLALKVKRVHEFLDYMNDEFGFSLFECLKKFI